MNYFLGEIGSLASPVFLVWPENLDGVCFCRYHPNFRRIHLLDNAGVLFAELYSITFSNIG